MASMQVKMVMASDADACKFCQLPNLPRIFVRVAGHLKQSVYRSRDKSARVRIIVNRLVEYQSIDQDKSRIKDQASAKLFR